MTSDSGPPHRADQDPPRPVGDAHAGLRMPEHHHSDVSGGWLRPAVFGAMDGLVSNVGLIAGVAGGGVAPKTVVLAGFAGLVSGAISMALGEFTSVKTQAEQVEAELEKERRELERNPDAEQDELAHMWMARGLPSHLAHEVARVVHTSPNEALRMHAQEELGIDPFEQPSPRTAAISSFACFAAGAMVPIVPYLLGFGELWLALAAGGLGLFATGALVARFTRRRWWFSGLRQLALGAAAAGITYAIGRLIGTAAGSL